MDLRDAGGEIDEKVDATLVSPAGQSDCSDFPI